ncbi:AAA family ATPase [Ruegeria sediminis]|uniref:AAA family ATPase n=1 Tax=Ruegeria sediminis TaxID=2583820 RepID=A0ABY2X4H5_9RHOB|nr:ATP-binding protein [Ruegeria sediminis]TMV09850.1 AAA family ATPase [Ruegeria sediminis]
MSEQKPLYNTLAPLRNVSSFLTLVRRLHERRHGLPGMGCFYGPSGYGKTTASVFAANEHQACVVQVKSVWTQKALCQAILSELGVKPAKLVYEMVDQISETLARRDVPLLIDEADHLVRKNMIEIVRDIYEGSFVPVVLIGEELLPQKLQKWERVHGRILSWAAAQPADEADFRQLQKIRLPGIELDDALAAKMVQASRGSVRRIVENLDEAREIAAVNGLRKVTVADWGKRAFFTGLAPEARRLS